MRRYIFSSLLSLMFFSSFGQVKESVNILIQDKVAFEGDTIRIIGPLRVESSDTSQIECKVSKIEVFLSRSGKFIGNISNTASASINLNKLTVNALPGDKMVIIVNYKLYKNGQVFKAGKLIRKVVAG